MKKDEFTKRSEQPISKGLDPRVIERIKTYERLGWSEPVWDTFNGVRCVAVPNFHYVAIPHNNKIRCNNL